MAASIGGALMAAGGTPAGGQTALPEVVVSAPSPIVTTPRTTAAPGTSTEAASADGAPEDPRPIVADGFVPVTVMPSLEILKTPAASIGDVVFTQPGVTSSTFAPGASRPVIRGLDNARVRVQENGIGSMDASTLSEDHAVPIDPLSTDRLEIVRGPATLRWGPQAIGGVVAATNNRIPDPATPDGIQVTNKGAITSVDRGREGLIAVDARANNVAVHADYFRRATGDYRIPGGVQENTWTDTWGASVGGSYIFQDGFFGVAVSHIESRYGIPGLEAANERLNIDMAQTKIMSRGELRLDGFIDTVRFWLGATSYRHHERGLEHDDDDHHHEHRARRSLASAGAPSPFLPARDLEASHIHATFENREIEGRLEAQHRPIVTAFGVLTGAAGIQAGHRDLRITGEESSLLAPSITNNVAAYLFEELRITDTVRMQAGGRVGLSDVRGTAALFPTDLLPDGSEIQEVARHRTFVPVSASIGILKDLPWGMVAGLNASYAERAPEALELFAKGPHHASGTFEIGNPNLGKESAVSIEASLRRAKGNFRFDFTAFHTRYSGFIYKRLTGAFCGDDFDSCHHHHDDHRAAQDDHHHDTHAFRQVAFDQRNANFTGVELAAQLDLAPVAGGVFGIDGQYDFVHARFDDGSSVPRMPPHRLGGGVFWRDGAWFARVGLLHAFAQNDVAAEETPTPGYNLLKAELSYTSNFRPGQFLRTMTVGVVGTNLLDEDVRNSVSFKKDEVLLPGRGVRVFASMRW